VRHDLLLPQIPGADTSSNVLDWFGRYLDGRMQKQRSVGGLLLFSIFINDFRSGELWVEIKYSNDADDLYGDNGDNPIHSMGTYLEFQESVRSLVIVLDERLTWTAHMNDIVKRVNFRLKHLYTFRYFLNLDVKKGMVHALVQPIFDFCDFLITVS
jgi:hypothetical protein